MFQKKSFHPRQRLVSLASLTPSISEIPESSSFIERVKGWGQEIIKVMDLAPPLTIEEIDEALRVVIPIGEDHLGRTKREREIRRIEEAEEDEEIQALKKVLSSEKKELERLIMERKEKTRRKQQEMQYSKYIDLDSHYLIQSTSNVAIPELDYHSRYKGVFPTYTKQESSQVTARGSHWKVVTKPHKSPKNVIHHCIQTSIVIQDSRVAVQIVA